MEHSSDIAALLLFLLAAFGSALVITNLRQASHGVSKSSSAVGVETEIESCDRKLVEAAIAGAAIRFSEPAHQETLSAAADHVSDAEFSYQWRTSLTTIQGAAGVLLMRGKPGANRLERTLLTDIRDEAVQLGQLLTSALPASRATRN